MLLFLCRHVVHAACVNGGDQLPLQPAPVLRGIGMIGSSGSGLSGKIALYVTFDPCSKTLLTNANRLSVLPLSAPGLIKAVLCAITGAREYGYDLDTTPALSAIGLLSTLDLETVSATFCRIRSGDDSTTEDPPSDDSSLFGTIAFSVWFILCIAFKVHAASTHY